MDPLTHALTSYALARSVLRKPEPRETLLVISAGLLPDIDVLSTLAGSPAGLRFGGVVSHSIVGASLLAALLACCFCAWERKRTCERHSFRWAFGLSALSIAAHLVLDLTNSHGLALLWPFRPERTAWGFTLMLDPILVCVLVLALLLPGLFRLVSEEIGARSGESAGRGWSIAALTFLAMFCGTRFFLQARAVTLLNANQYHRLAPLHAAAYADSANPFHWRGVVETEVSIEEVDMDLAPGANFSPDRSRAYYKPEASPLLDLARSEPAAARILALARFPSAAIEHTEERSRVEFRDIGFSPLRDPRGYYFEAISIDAQGRIVREELGYVLEKNR